MRDFDLRSVSERDLARLHHRNVERFDVCFVWAPQRREGVAIHQDVQLRLLGRNVSQNVLLGFKQLARFHLAHERLGRVGLADFVTRAADFGDLAKRNQIPSIQFQLGGRIEQAEIGSARLGENIQLLAARPFKSFDCIRSGDPCAHKIFSSERNDLFDRRHLVGEGIRRNIDKPGRARTAANLEIVPRGFLRDALFRRRPFFQRLLDRRIVSEDGARHFAE